MRVATARGSDNNDPFVKKADGHIGTETTVVDLRGRAVIPGFVAQAGDGQYGKKSALKRGQVGHGGGQAGAHFARERHLMGYHDHGHPILGKLSHDRQHFSDKLGVERGGYFVEQ